jgi:hypothetical protein
MSEFQLLNELKEREPMIGGDGSALPPVTIKEIQANIRKGAKDLDQNWKDAVHLTRKAYDVAGHDIPSMGDQDAWEQYTHLITVAVRELHKARGSSGQFSKWRSTDMRKFDDENTAIPKKMQPLDTLPADEKYLNKK